MPTTVTTTTTESDRKSLSRDEISHYLRKYEKKDTRNINIGTHIRYFSALREKGTHKLILRKDGTPKITFKRGGFLKIINLTKGYIILSNVPIQKKNPSQKVLNWSVTLDEHTTIFACKPKVKVDEQLELLLNEVESLKSQVSKLKKQKKQKY